MCGICGKLKFDLSAHVERNLICSMLASMSHRGPDDEGLYLSANVGLGHKRLSIIDLAAGHQPLSNEEGTIWIVFNGEIYNYRELRKFLLGKGHIFRTDSDTEVIVHLYEDLGPACLERLRGMFTFAIWDERDRSLFVARDRLGVKPLYYYCNGSFISFASEIKALLVDPGVRREVAPDAVSRFLTFSYLPGEQTLFQGVHKLRPASYLIVRDGKCDIRNYWDLNFSGQEPRRTQRQAETELLELLGEAVDMHMIADVPVGILLSGGIDSTAVLSFAAERTNKKIKTFTIGFSGSEVADERPYAKIAANCFGTEHHDTTITAADFVECMPRYVWHMEEPVCEPPAIALYYVSKLAKDYVTVLLSGEGGDEAFAGYSNYRNLLWLERAKRAFSPFNGAAAQCLSFATSVFRLPRVARYLPLLNATFPDYYYSRTSNPYRTGGNGLSNLYTDDFGKCINHANALEPMFQLHSQAKALDTLSAMLYVDTKSWLPDDLLIKADKMTMANSLELRVPLLDHKVIEFAASLPTNFKVRGLTTKYLAKKALSRRVPKAILGRRKAGFPVPYESWLRTDMRNWITDVLCDRRTRNRGYFATTAVRELLARNDVSGRYSKELFSLITLELWHRTFLDQRPSLLAA